VHTSKVMMMIVVI